MLRVRHGRIDDSAGVATATHLDFSPDIDEAEIDAYVATGEPLEVAGAFTIDGRGAAFIDRMLVARQRMRSEQAGPEQHRDADDEHAGRVDQEVATEVGRADVHRDCDEEAA